MSTSTQDEKPPVKLYLPKFCVVPLEAREDKTLNDSAKIYLGELNVLSNKFDYLTYSDEQLAEMKGVSVRTIKSWHTELEKRGFIYRDTGREHYKNPKCTGVLIRSKRKIYVIESPSKKVIEGQDSAPRSEGQNSAPRSEGQNSAPIKNTILRDKLENNNKPPAAAARGVVVFSCFSELEISQNLQQSLSNKMDEGKAILLVKRVKAWTSRSSDAAACHTILAKWDSWEDAVPKEHREADYKNWAKTNLKPSYEGVPGRCIGYRCEVLNKHVEFIPSEGVGQPICFSYEVGNFIKEIGDFILNLSKGVVLKSRIS